MQALEITGLRKTYSDGTEALRGIDLSVDEGQFYALLGANGAGKSTTIGIVTSLVRKSGGQVRVFGHDLDTEPEQVRKAIGLVPQEFNFNQFEPVEEIVLNQAGFYGLPRGLARQRTEHLLQQLELWSKRRTQARQLSGGMKRRLMIARALVHEPRLLILDEPTAGVDIEIRHSMWTYLRDINAAGTTIILTTHYLEEAESLCRQIAIINHGEIVERAEMNQLLRRLHEEILVLDLSEPLAQAPTLAGYELTLVDSTTLEAKVPQNSGINGLFSGLAGQGIEVTSLRNKQNRLEQLFIGVLGRGGSA